MLLSPAVVTPCHDILKCDKHGMSHVQLAGHIGGWHWDGKGWSSGSGVRGKVTAVLPPVEITTHDVAHTGSDNGGKVCKRVLSLLIRVYCAVMLQHQK